MRSEDYERIARQIRDFLPSSPPCRGTVEVYELTSWNFELIACADHAGGSKGYYRMCPRAVVLRSPVDRETAVHEMTHAVVDCDWGITRPEWFCEGLAEMVVHVLVRGCLPRRRMAPPAVVSLGRHALYGPGFNDHYRILASYVAWLAWNEGMRNLLERFMKGG